LLNLMFMKIATADIANTIASHSKRLSPRNSEYIPAIQTLQHLKQVNPSKKCPGSSEVCVAAQALKRSNIAPGPLSSCSMCTMRQTTKGPIRMNSSVIICFSSVRDRRDRRGRSGTCRLSPRHPSRYYGF